MKNDSGKARYDLLGWRTIDDMARIMADGAAAHGDEGWKTLPNAKDRYFSAAMRHIVAWRNGENIDVDSGFHHLAHAICNLMFLLELTKGSDYTKLDELMSGWPKSKPTVPFTLADGAGSD